MGIASSICIPQPMQSARPVMENPLAFQQTSIINTEEGRGYIKSNTY